MGGKSEKGEIMEWTTQNTKAFIEKNYGRLKKGQLQGSTFKITIWEEINNELTEITGTNYGVDKLKGKFNRLRQLHREFSTLLSRTGVTWDSEANKVHAPEEKGRFYKNFKKHGFELDYDILGEIFNSSTTTGKLSQAFTQQPPTSDEERDLEGDFLTKGVHVEPDVFDCDGDDLQELRNKRKAVDSSSDHRRKVVKNSSKDTLEATLSLWTNSMSARSEASKARTEASKAKADRYEAKLSQATSPETDPYSTEACMEMLDSIEDISTEVYNNVLMKFTNKDWRVMFIRMPSFRRKDWLASLKENK
ncbi:Myb/SANT-like domain [Sesbania bispinosa]|nr:Myb/SANT-like domain [Sesbania bispinosa]